MNLPPQIVQMIFPRLSKRDLKSCRLAFKAWDRMLIAMLFDSVFVTARHADLEVADLVASRFGDFVETLVYSAEFFGDPALFNKYSKLAIKKRSQPCYERHIYHHCQTYANLALEQRDILKDGISASFLQENAPYIKGRTYSFMAKTTTRLPFDTTFTCSNENCNFSTCHEFREDHFTHARPARGAPDQGASRWGGLMNALATSHIVVREIRTLAPMLDTMPLNIWRPSYRLGEIMIKAFSSLTKLDVTLDLHYLKSNSQGNKEYPMAKKTLMKALSSATELESLHISLRYTDWDDEIRKHAINFGSLFKTCSFPKLESVSLHRCSADEGELLSFLKRSPAVKSLILKWFQLTGGYWTTLVQDIRDTTKVKDLQLVNIRGSMGDSEGEDIDNFEVGDCGLEDDVQALFNRQKGSRVSNAELKYIVENRRMKIVEEAEILEELLDGRDGIMHGDQP